MKKLYLNHLKIIIKSVLLEDAIIESGTTKCSVCGAPVKAKDLSEKAKDAVCPYCNNPYNWESYNAKYGSKVQGSNSLSTTDKTMIAGKQSAPIGMDSKEPTPEENNALSNLNTDEGTSVEVAKMFYVEMKKYFKDIIGPGQIKEKYGFYKPIIRIGDNASENFIKKNIENAYNDAEPTIQQLMRKVGGVIVNGKFYFLNQILPSTQQATPQQKVAPSSPMLSGTPNMPSLAGRSLLGRIPAKR